MPLTRFRALTIACPAILLLASCEASPQPRTADDLSAQEPSSQPKADVRPEKEPPRCATLTEKCIAEPGTRVAVGSRGFSFLAPVGWSFARQKYALTVSPAADVVLGFTEASSPESSHVIGALEPLLETFGISEVDLALLTPRLDKPQTTLSSEAGEVNVWEIDKPSNGGRYPRMGEKRGKLAVFVARAVAPPIVGLAFMDTESEEKRGLETGAAVQTLRCSSTICAPGHD